MISHASTTHVWMDLLLEICQRCYLSALAKCILHVLRDSLPSFPHRRTPFCFQCHHLPPFPGLSGDPSSPRCVTCLAGPQRHLIPPGTPVSRLARGAIVSARASGAAPALGLALGFAAPVDSSLLPLAGPQITPSRVSQQIGLSSPHLGFHYLAEMKRYLLGGGFPSPQPVPKS